MAAHVRLTPSGREFPVEGNDTILEAALRAGLALSYGCSNGNCGLCKAKIVSGEIKKVQSHDFVIGEAEKRQGYALLCANTAVSDLVIEASEAKGVQDIPLQQIATRVKKAETLGTGILLLHLQTPRTRRLRFLAGQHARLELAGGLSEEHPIASCPCDDRNLQFHIARRPGHAFSDYVFTKLKPAATVTLEGPAGDFVLQQESPRSLLFIAWDTGFAPIKSLIEHAMSLEVAEHMHFYWTAATPDGHYLHNLCRSWTDALDNFDYTPLVATPTPEESAEGLIGRVAQDHPQLKALDAYVAAPDAIADAIEFGLLDRGLPRAQLHIERCE